jgi:eukaryotic-like serine/threonine-protein kinase
MTEPRLVGGRYEVGHLLGYGGMAEVHLGRDVRLGRRVALKILRSDLARDPSFQTRFRREAQSAGSLNHPSIVAVYDTGEDTVPTANGGTEVVPFIVMEYVEGRTLREVLTNETRLDSDRAMEIVGEICAALDFSHRHGIIHRDIKPGNVMITKTGAVKVMDFGIARAVADEAATMTQTASVIGTAQYLSPEQARGETVDARSDVYSTGCVLYELITGVPPFQGDSPVAVAYQHVRESAPVPSSINPSVPRALDSIVMKALAKNPMNRYQSAGDMRADLQRALADRPIAAEPVLSDSERTQLIAASPPSPRVDPNPLAGFDDGVERGSGKAVAAWLVGVLVLLLVLGIGAYVLLKPSTKKEATSATVPNLIGLKADAVPAALLAQGLTAAVGMPSYVYSCAVTTVAVNQVCSQTPLANTTVDPSVPVKWTVLQARANVPVPSVRGLTRDAASKKITDAGLQPQPKTVHDSTEAGTVVGQTPDSGVSAKPNSVVSFSVADGKVLIPTVKGLTLDDALSTLNTDELLNTATKAVPTTIQNLDGTVQDSQPAAGAWITKSTKITLAVYKYTKPTLTTTPSAPPTTPTTPPAGSSSTPSSATTTTSSPTSPPTSPTPLTSPTSVTTSTSPIHP